MTTQWPATCSPSVDGWWGVFRTVAGKDPCQVRGQLRLQCSLPIDTEQYPPVPLSDSNSCCLYNSGVYEVYGACNACQNATLEEAPKTFITLANWGSLCVSTFKTVERNSSFFESLLPEWATETARKDNGVFNINTAYSTASNGVILPSNSNHSSPTNGASASIASTIDAPPSAASTPSSNGVGSSSSSKKSNAGAIAGGVVAAVVVIVALAFALFYARKKKQSRVPPSAEFTKYMQQPVLHRPLTNQSENATKDATEQVPLTSESYDAEALPAFTPGHYAGPVFEKEGYTAAPSKLQEATGSSKNAQ